MDYKQTYKIIEQLPFDKKLTILKESDIDLYLIRPSKLSARFKNYDLSKNFQIWMKDKDKEFRPNHLRVMIDLNLRVRSRPELSKDIALAFDEIFFGRDPEEAIAKLININFAHFLNPIKIISYLSQLFLIEQDLNYYKESKYDPANLFYQGWIRQIICSSKEIDNIVMSIAHGQPPLEKYTYMNNKNNKRYSSNPKPLWYFE